VRSAVVTLRLELKFLVAGSCCHSLKDVRFSELPRKGDLLPVAGGLSLKVQEVEWTLVDGVYTPFQAELHLGPDLRGDPALEKNLRNHGWVW